MHLRLRCLADAMSLYETLWNVWQLGYRQFIRSPRRAQQNRLGHRKAERLGGLGVETHHKFGRQLNRQVCRLCATENAIDVGGRAAILIEVVCSVGKQTAVSYEGSIIIDRRYIVSGCHRYN
jgi:hypothetical protein